MGAGHIINYNNFENESSMSNELSSFNKKAPNIIVLSPITNINDTNSSIEKNTYYKQTILTISSSDIINDLESEEHNIFSNVKQPTKSRKRNNRNIIDKFKTNDIYNGTKDGITLLNTNDFTTTGGGMLFHNTGVYKETDDIECRNYTLYNKESDDEYVSKKILLHKDKLGDYFIHTPKIIQSSPNLKTIYESIFPPFQYRRKQRSFHFKSSINLSNFIKHYSISNIDKSNSNNKNELLLLQISIDDSPKKYKQAKLNFNYNKTNNNNSKPRNYLHKHSKSKCLPTTNQIISDNNNNNLNFIPCIFKDSIQINLNSKTIQKEFINKITSLYNLAKNKNSISLVDEIQNEFQINKSSSIYKELMSNNSHVIYSSYLNKMINEINASVPNQTKYSYKFCTITKQQFSYYISKEKFIMLKKPIISLPITQIIKVSLINTNNKLHLLLFFESNNLLIKKAAFKNTYNKNEGYFIFAGCEKDLFLSPKIKNVITDKEVCKWFLILNYLLLNNKDG